jgi:hypothetical protein
MNNQLYFVQRKKISFTLAGHKGADSQIQLFRHVSMYKLLVVDQQLDGFHIKELDGGGLAFFQQDGKSEK